MSTRSALIAYGSETGNAQEIAEEVGRITRRFHFATRVTELNAISLDELGVVHEKPSRYDLVVFAISTTGQGDLPANSQSFWKRLLSRNLRPNCLQSLCFISFGIGDSSYPQFNWAHRKLYNRLKQLGANPICERGEADEQHPEGVDGSFVPWSTSLKNTLLARYPPPQGLSPIPDEVFLEPEFILELTQPGLNGYESHQRSVDRAATTTTEAGFTQATLAQNVRLTPDTHWQDVRLFKFETPSHSYGPGDVLTIFPQNFAEDVDQILHILGWSETADQQMHFIETNHSSHINGTLSSRPDPPRSGMFTLRDLLMQNLDFNAIPRRSFFATLAHFTDDETQKERLIEFTKLEYIDELYDYTTRPRRSILEVLQEFDTVKIPYKWAASIFPSIRGRQFSIASGGELKKGPDNNSSVELLVAIVRYKTVIKKIRQGLCTRYLAVMQPGTKINVAFSKSGMKVDLDRPAIMVGPGTGVAPLRSMIHERAALASERSLKDLVLFYGGRNKTADYFFEDEWEALKRHTMHLEVHPAFSRDQTSKVYVQDLIRSNSSSIFPLLREGVVYVCGSSGKMPQAVREAITEVLQDQGRTPRHEAEARLAAMEKHGRYQQETW